MIKHYSNYYWKNGKPYGEQEIDPLQTPLSYKIIVDPYFKRFSIEKYHFTHFNQTIYDSYLLDFRHLTEKNQTAWQREILKEEKEFSHCILRNQDDRAILIEMLNFEGTLCRICKTHSIHGIPLSVHRMFYQSLNDPFNGVVLFDIENKPVMMKTYTIDPLSEEFTELLTEQWDMQFPPQFIHSCPV